MNEAIRARRVEAVRRGLKIISDGQPHSRKELLGVRHQSETTNGYFGWQTRVIVNMRKIGLIKTLNPSNGPGSDTQHTCYQLEDGVKDRLSDPELPVGLLWPTRVHLSLPGATPQEEESRPPTNVDDAGGVAETTLKLVAAAVENLVWMRDRIEQIEKKLEWLAGQWSSDGQAPWK